MQPSPRRLSVNAFFRSTSPLAHSVNEAGDTSTGVGTPQRLPLQPLKAVLTLSIELKAVDSIAPVDEAYLQVTEPLLKVNTWLLVCVPVYSPVSLMMNWAAEALAAPAAQHTIIAVASASAKMALPLLFFFTSFSL